MEREKVFIIMNGPSCAGKSTITKLLLSKHKTFFKLSYDNVKRFYSDYKVETHFEKVYEILSAMARAAVSQGYNVFVDGGIKRKNREGLIQIFKDAGYKVYEFNIEASQETLLERFDRRVKESAEKNIPITNTSVDRLLKLEKMYHEDKNIHAITYETDMVDAEDIVKSIEGYIGL